MTNSNQILTYLLKAVQWNSRILFLNPSDLGLKRPQFKRRNFSSTKWHFRPKSENIHIGAAVRGSITERLLCIQLHCHVKTTNRFPRFFNPVHSNRRSVVKLNFPLWSKGSFKLVQILQWTVVLPQRDSKNLISALM